MKKKTLTLLLALCYALSMTACTSEKEVSETTVAEGAFATESETEENDVETEPATEEETESETESEVETESEKSIPNMPSELSDDLYDFQVSINGTVYQFPMWYSDFEALGWTYEGDNTQTLSSNQYSSSDYWEKDGHSVLVSLANLSMNSAPYSECMVSKIKFDNYFFRDSDWKIILPGNIQYGVSTIEDIKAAYGEPTYESEGNSTYTLLYSLDSYREIKLSVLNDTNVLGFIEICNITELEGADNSVDSSIPDITKNYEAPSSLGSDFYSYNIELEGHLYTLPCPVSEFIANGFEINEAESDMELAAGDIGSIELNYNDMVFSSTLFNYADYATTIENCFVTSVSCYDYGNLNFSLVTPGNIKIGSSEDEVKKAIEGFNYTETTKATGITYYRVYPSDDKVLDDYEIGVDDGIVTSISVHNSEMPENK